MEPKICTKMLKKLSEKLRAKFPATTPGCSIVKIAHLDDKQASRRLITTAKRKEKEKKERRKKKFQKSKSLKT